MYNSGVVVTPQQFEGWARLTALRLRQQHQVAAAVSPSPTPLTPTGPTAATTRTTSTRIPTWSNTGRRSQREAGDMAIDTSVGEFEYPGEEEVGAAPSATSPLAPLPVAAAERPVGDRRGRHRVPHRPLAGQRHRQRLHPGPGHGPERRRHRARPLPGRRRLDGRHRRPELPAGEDPRRTSSPRPRPRRAGSATSA